jgi:hypothetical protein
VFPTEEYEVPDVPYTVDLELVPERLAFLRVPPFASYFLIASLEAVIYQAGLPRTPKAPSEHPEIIKMKLPRKTNLKSDGKVYSYSFSISIYLRVIGLLYNCKNEFT